jgi:RNA-splicing ligase RtcB
MDSVQIITNEWIDIIYLDNKTKKAIRKNLNFGGSYYFENNQSILHIVWNIWGKETFYKKKDIYYNILSNIFEIELQNNKGAKETNNKNNTKDTKVYIFNTEDNSVYLK